jgi:hypothetical protein
MTFFVLQGHVWWPCCKVMCDDLVCVARLCMMTMFVLQGHLWWPWLCCKVVSDDFGCVLQGHLWWPRLCCKVVCDDLGCVLQGRMLQGHVWWPWLCVARSCVARSCVMTLVVHCRVDCEKMCGCKVISWRLGRLDEVSFPRYFHQLLLACSLGYPLLLAHSPVISTNCC